MRGIVMMGVSVLGLLSGAKTRTRRLAKRENPLYRPGETLYVKEAIEWTSSVTTTRTGITRDAAVYQADRLECPLDTWPWKNDVLAAMFMPQALRRFEVTIVEVRRQPLLDITRDDAWAEGVFEYQSLGLDVAKICHAAKLVGCCAEDPQAWYLSAWDTMHREHQASTNPLVDAYTLTVRRLPSNWKADMTRALASGGCSSQTEWVERNPGVHCWFMYGEYPSCACCGVVQRWDGKNKPCKGIVTIELR